jgi:PPOX class probable F420-dependent enzyme
VSASDTRSATIARKNDPAGFVAEVEVRRRGEGLMARLTDAQKRFLDEPFVGVVSTIRDDGTPHSTVVWVDSEDGFVEFNTARGRAKPRNLERDPRATLTVVDPQNPYRWMSVTGHAELVDEGADDHIDRLAKKYLGKDEYPWDKNGRVTVRIAPEKVDAYGIDE